MQIETRLTVRYAETDQMGIVHHSNYPIWFEVGRTSYLKNAGFSYADIEAKGILFPLYELNCRFKSPARYEDEILVRTQIKYCTRVRICFSYEIINAMTNKLISEGETMHAWTDQHLNPINAEKIIPEIYNLLKD